MEVEYYRDSRGEWRSVVKAANGEPLFVSSEGYANLEDCLHAIDLLRRNVSSASVNSRPTPLFQYINALAASPAPANALAARTTNALLSGGRR